MIRIVVILLICGFSTSLHGSGVDIDEGLGSTETTGLLVNQGASGWNATNSIAEGQDTTMAAIGEDFGALDTSSTEPAQGDQETTNVSGSNDVELIDILATNDTASATSELFWNGFFSTLGMILVNECMDKTFLIAVVLAMHNPRLVVFAGSWSALMLMTVGASVIGFLAQFVPKWIIVFGSAIVMIFFGVKMLIDACRMTEQSGEEEYEVVEKEIEMEAMDGSELESANDALTAVPETIKSSTFRASFKIFVKAFGLTCLAEFGDRSQVATLLLASTDNTIGVMLGGVFGHAICTGTAVFGGKAVANFISLRKITVIGGILFLFFALISIVLFILDKEL